MPTQHDPDEAVIRLETYEPEILTTAEFEQLERVVTSRVMLGEVGVAERILARLIREHRARYEEAKATNAARASARVRQP